MIIQTRIGHSKAVPNAAIWRKCRVNGRRMEGLYVAYMWAVRVMSIVMPMRSTTLACDRDKVKYIIWALPRLRVAQLSCSCSPHINIYLQSENGITSNTTSCSFTENETPTMQTLLWSPPSARPSSLIVVPDKKTTTLLRSNMVALSFVEFLVAAWALSLIASLASLAFQTHVFCTNSNPVRSHL